jgi:Uma2 family endonuclease
MSVAVIPELTYEQWRLLPETKERYEIIDGVIRMSPPPSPDHQWINQNLSDILSPHVRAAELGVVLVAPVDILIRRHPLRTRQPDLLFLSAERTGVRGRKELREMPHVDVPVDLGVEVLSPSNSRIDIERKLEDYLSVGMREVWLVSPEAETVEVLRLSEGRVERVGLYGAGQPVHSEVLPDLRLTVDQVFA